MNTDENMILIRVHLCSSVAQKWYFGGYRSIPIRWKLLAWPA